MLRANLLFSTDIVIYSVVRHGISVILDVSFRLIHALCKHLPQVAIMLNVFINDVYSIALVATR